VRALGDAGADAAARRDPPTTRARGRVVATTWSLSGGKWSLT